MENKNNSQKNQTFKNIVQQKLIEYSENTTKNVKTCSTKLKNLFKTTREKLHRITYSTASNPELKYNKSFRHSNFNKKFKYKKVSFGGTTYFSEDDEDIKKNNFDGVSYYFPEKENPKNADQTKYMFDGKTTIWINNESIQLYPNKPEHEQAINIVKPKKKYCLIARSKIIKNVPITSCITINGKQLTNKSKEYMEKHKIILCKKNDWKTHVLGEIIRIHVPITKEEPILFDIMFPSCPESEIVLAWHNDSSIKKDTTVIRYDKQFSFKKNNLINNSLGEKKENSIIENKIIHHFKTPPATPLTSPELEALAIEPSENMPNLTLELNNIINESNDAPFCLDEDNLDNNNVAAFLNEYTLNEEFKKSIKKIQNIQNEYKNETIKSREPSPEPDTEKYLYPSGKCITKSKDTEVLMYNAYWFKHINQHVRKKTPIIYKRKQVVVADSSCSENYQREFLENIKILNPQHFKNIFKIQQAYGRNIKVVSLRNNYYISKIDNKLEPQNLRGFEFTTSPNKIAHALNNKLFCTYTGPLCYEAKKYLFSLN